MLMEAKLALAGSAMLVAAGTAVAQTRPAQPAASAQPQSISKAAATQRIDAEFKSIDTNSDGHLTKAEIDAGIARNAAELAAALKKRQADEFGKLDTNKDGRLTLAEYQAGTTIQARAGVGEQRLKLLDANKDGRVSAAEFRNEALTRFDRLDTNKDGVISAADAQTAQNRRP
jgi:hypothetical protein